MYIYNRYIYVYSVVPNQEISEGMLHLNSTNLVAGVQQIV